MSELQVFQVGVRIVEERTTDMIVRVRACNMQEARKLAREAVEKQCQEAVDEHDLIKNYSVEWETTGFHEDGDSFENYSNMDKNHYPDADLDLTAEEQK